MGSAGFDRDEDFWPRQWAEAYVDFAAGEKRSWLHDQGLRLFPLVQWAERGGYFPGGPRQLGAAVPRHLGHRARGGRAVPAPGPRGRQARGLVRPAVPAPRDRAEPDRRRRRRGRAARSSSRAAWAAACASSRVVVGDFALRAQAVIVTSGGIGANHDLVRRNWPARMGQPPAEMLSGRAGPRRRPDDRDRRGGRRAG